MWRDCEADEVQPYKLEQAWREPSGKDSGEKMQREALRSNGKTETAGF